jgi:hypothetical protein
LCVENAFVLCDRTRRKRQGNGDCDSGWGWLQASPGPLSRAAEETPRGVADKLLLQSGFCGPVLPYPLGPQSAPHILLHQSQIVSIKKKPESDRERCRRSPTCCSAGPGSPTAGSGDPSSSTLPSPLGMTAAIPPPWPSAWPPLPPPLHLRPPHCAVTRSRRCHRRGC